MSDTQSPDLDLEATGTPTVGLTPGVLPADQKDTGKKTRTVPLNNFPEDLYQALQPAYTRWNAGNDSLLSFGYFVISLLRNGNGIAAQLTEAIRKCEELKAERDATADDAAELQIENEALTAANRGFADDFARKEKELRELREALARATAGQVPGGATPGVATPGASQLAPAWDQAAHMAGLDAVLKKAAEMSAPGIVPRFTTFSKEQYQLLYNKAYLSALQ